MRILVAVGVLGVLISALAVVARNNDRRDLVVDLGSSQSNDNSAESINGAGDVAGEVNGQPCLWRGGHRISLPLLPDAISGHTPNEGRAKSINNNGCVVGDSDIGGGPAGNERQTYHAVKWTNGSIQDLGVPAGYSCSSAERITDTGRISGVAQDIWRSAKDHSYAGTTWVSITSPIRSTRSTPYAVCYNNRGDFVQSEGDADGRRKIVLYTGRRRKVLERLAIGHSTVNLFINDRREVAGTILDGIATWDPLGPDFSLHSKAYVWTSTGRRTALGVLPGYPTPWVRGLNNRGDVVGEVRDATRTPMRTRAVLWLNGKAIDLSTASGASGHWLIKRANGVNDSGFIVGEGAKIGEGNGFSHALLIKPLKL